jgi:hypothetical protein
MKEKFRDDLSFVPNLFGYKIFEGSRAWRGIPGLFKVEGACELGLSGIFAASSSAKLNTSANSSLLT